jgi:nicotinamide-nucleotide amidase
MFTGQVLPRLAARGGLLDHEAYLQLRTAGVGESQLETLLQPVFDRYGEGLELAYCAHHGQVDCRLSSPAGTYPLAQLQSVADECARLLGDDLVCYGHDPLAKVVADLLRAQEKTLAVAESCTGGLLSNSFTDVCGATKFFQGGIVCYSNDSKMQLLDVPGCLLAQHGAVSAEVAIALATGASETLEADYGLSVTGFAGPCGGTTENPVGTIFIGLHAPEGVWSRRIEYPGPRTAVKQRAVNAALDWLRRQLLREAKLAARLEPVP